MTAGLAIPSWVPRLFSDISNDQLLAICTILVAVITVGGTLLGIWLTWALSRITARQADIHDKLTTSNGHTVGQYVEGLAKSQGVDAYDPDTVEG